MLLVAAWNCPPGQPLPPLPRTADPGGDSVAARLLLANQASNGFFSGGSAAEVASRLRRALGDGTVLRRLGSDCMPFWGGLYLMIAADALDLAAPLVREARDLATAHGSVNGQRLVALHAGELALRRGSLAEARAYVDEPQDFEQ